MKDRSVIYWNRYTAKLETEPIYGENFVRWAYETSLGRASLECLVKRPIFSLFYGYLMNLPSSRRKIEPFIQQYQLDSDEFEDSPSDFRTFNDFFFRKLKSSSRPICGDENIAVFPADGRHLGVQVIDQAQGFYVKGRRMDLAQLLASERLAEKYASGTMVISRLCPIDYHRFHFPISGQTRTPHLIRGYLYSVSPIALRRNLGYLLSNKRYVTEVDSPDFGHVLVLEIGATCVGRVVHSVIKPALVEKGMEKGYFLFGGSCVMTLFEPGKVQLAEDLQLQSCKGYELYAKMGDVMAVKAN